MDDETIARVVMVKVAEAIELSGVDTDFSISLADLAALANDSDSPQVMVIEQAIADPVFSWPFVSVSGADIDGLVERAQSETPEYTAPDFRKYLELVCSPETDAQAVANALDGWSAAVEYAYLVDLAEDPLVAGTGNPFFDQGLQNYLTAAPAGIDAAAAWGKGADGSGIDVIDIEQGWFLTQEDLPTGIAQLQGTNKQTSFAHGTGVLGIVVGQDNGVGIVGGAPAANAQVISYNDSIGGATLVQRVWDRIISAANALPFGHVMLLEIQFAGQVGGQSTLLPVESDPLVLQAIQLVTALGTIVVEAGGNGGADLDTFVMAKGPLRGKATLQRGSTDFEDSGAIMVGAARSIDPHERLSFSNFGSRVDCYAWGENIVTTGWSAANPAATDTYWGINGERFFGGTSGASPIIVSACLLVQSLRTILTPTSGQGLLGPFRMRRMLSEPANGTASFTVTDRIGSMPSLALIIANEFQP